MIILYLLIIASLGFTAFELLNNFFPLKTKKITYIEYGIVASCFGFLIFTLYMLILAFLNIKYNFLILFTIPILNFIIVSIVLIKRIISKFKNSHNKFKIKFKFGLCLNIIFDIMLLIIFIYLFLKAYSNHVMLADEFNYWAIQARTIFIDKVTNSFKPSYPSFSPYLTSGYYFFINSIRDNQVRIIQTIFLIFCCLLTIDFGKKYSINKLFIKLFYILIILLYPTMIDVSSSLYADVSFMFFYSFSILYLYEWLFKDRNNFYFLCSIIFLALTVWTKTDGLYLSLYSYFIVVLSSIFYKKISITKVNSKKIIWYFFTTISPILLWKAYLRFYVPLSKSPVLSSDIRLFNFPSMLNAMNNQIFSYRLVTFLFIVSVIIIFIIIPKYYKDYMLNFYFLFSFIAVNFMFLVVCYLTIFGIEGLTAASFIRYMSHILPVLIFIISYIFNNCLGDEI